MVLSPPSAPKAPVSNIKAPTTGGKTGGGIPANGLITAGGIIGAIFLLPSVLAEGCKLGGQTMGIPPGVCPYIAVGGCCSCCSCLMMVLLATVTQAV